jgi:hypothetical protein
MFSLLKTWSVLAGIFIAVVLVAAPVMAHGHARHSVNCIFGVDGVQVQIRDLGDGVLLTMTSDDEEVVARLQKSAWEQVEPEDGTREHDCFFHMASVQVLVKEVYNGVILTITSTDEETVAKLQKMARRKTKKGCRHSGHRGLHR